MRRYLLGAATLALLAFGGTATAEERIRSFDSAITVNPDGSLDVRETIRVNAEHKSINRGIYREFPTIYPGDGGRQVVVGFRFKHATRDGEPENWRVESRGNGWRVYLGNPDRAVSLGEHTYEIEYHTDRQMGFFADHDELYWNATGNGWDFSIDHATARVLLPDSIPRDQVRMEGYTGPQGIRRQEFTATIDDGAAFFSTTRPLGWREGLTIVVMWPKGFITQPVRKPAPQRPAVTLGQSLSSAGQASSRAKPAPHSPLPLLIAVLGFALVNFLFYRAWDRVGRDPPGRVIIPEYEPPSNLSPAAMRYLLECGGDRTGFTAAVLSLAVKGHVRIDQSKGFLGLGKVYTLTRVARADARPPSYDERELLESLFRRAGVVDLKQENHRVVSEAISAHEDALRRQYSKDYFNRNVAALIKGILCIVLVITLTLAWPDGADSHPNWMLATPLGWLTDAILVAMVASAFVWGRLIRAPTAKGAELIAHIRGFRQYLQVAEGEELKNVASPPPPLTPQLYEAYLPAALALGVQQKWAERFVGVFDLKEPNYSPAWYSGSGFHAGSIGGFTSGLSSSLGSAISSSSQAPGSHSGGSSGSSGGGGGGYSGGGGGGGGGGGW